jgi:hypothetical protein
MRSTRLLILTLGLTALAACSSDEVSTSTLPPFGAVRFINAVADTGAVDFRMIDQLEFSAIGNGVNFRTGTEYQVTEAKTRKIRVFLTSRDINVTQVALLDADVEVPANSRITLLLTGSARAKTLKFVTINDDASAPAAGSIAVRLVNTASGAVNGYVVATPTSTIADPASAANVATLGASPYVTRTTGDAAVRVTDVGSATVNASAAGPVATVLAGALPAAGVNSAGTKFSVYYFPRGVAGSAQNALATPGAVWFVDRNPSDQ